MATDSAIGWTDHTFNPWWGCTKVHQGCKNCYAETLDARWGGDHWGPKNPRRMIVGEWSKPIVWNDEARAAGVVRRVFCASMCDLFEDFDGPVVDQRGQPIAVPASMPMYASPRIGGSPVWTVAALRARVFTLIHPATPNLDWLLLTKRPENVRRMVPEWWLSPGCWPKNVMVGTSPCDQATADEAIPHLLNVPGRRFLSCEPLLGPLDLDQYLYAVGGSTAGPWGYPSGRRVPASGIGGAMISRRPAHEIDWVITGGESGAGHRNCDPAWQESIVDQCEAAGVPVFVKQDSGAYPGKQGRLSDRVWSFKHFPPTQEPA